MGVYFVSEVDLREENKSIDMAIGLTFFLGVLGIHRFYLGRYASGLIYWAALLLTAWQALWVIIPLVIIEFIQLSALKEKIDKAKLAETAAVENLSSKIVSKVPTATSSSLGVNRPQRVISDIKPTPHHTVALHVPPVGEESERESGIYDVSNIETSVLDSKKQELIIEKDAPNSWAQRLELPYERRDLRIVQLRQGTYFVYEQLAEYMDQGLRREGSSLEELGRQAVAEGSYYGNILYTLFCIAEGEVTNYYSGGERGYDNSFSYQILETRVNKLYIEHLKQYAVEVTSKLPSANEETRLYFGLTKNGLSFVWWDMDGVLRGSGRIPKKFIRILNITPPRNTKLYEIPGIRTAILLHYCRVITLLEQQYDTVPNWPVRIKTYLGRVFDENRKYVENPYNFTLLNYILKLSEQAVRENIPYARTLDTAKERASIQKGIPKAVASVILAALDNLKPLKLSNKTLELLRAQNPTAWKSDLVDIANASLEKVIVLLERYNRPGEINKVANEVIKKHDDPKAKLLAFYALSVIDGSLDEKLHKSLLAVIHYAQLGSYDKLVSQNKKLSPQLADRLLDLSKAPRKQVVLSDERLATARSDYNRAIRSVAGYLSEEAVDSDTLKVEPSTELLINRESLFTASKNESLVLPDDHRQFLGLLVESPEGIDASVGLKFAREQKKMLNGYLQAINKTLYDKFEDQVIVQRDGRIIIDDEYVVAVKGLL